MGKASFRPSRKGNSYEWGLDLGERKEIEGKHGVIPFGRINWSLAAMTIGVYPQATLALASLVDGYIEEGIWRCRQSTGCLQIVTGACQPVANKLKGGLIHRAYGHGLEPDETGTLSS